MITEHSPTNAPNNVRMRQKYFTEKNANEVNGQNEEEAL